MTVLGVDAYKRGWVAVALDYDGFVGAFVARDIAAIESEADSRWGVEIIVIDVPIGIPDIGPRQADALARAFVGPRASSVFATPNRAALPEPDRASADAASRSVGGQGVSAQAFAIRDRILEVNGHLPRARARLLEGHPEVSFREMARLHPLTAGGAPVGGDAGANDAPLAHGKASAAGLMLRTLAAHLR
jgi:predicted RNase H-like nuclease